METLEKLAQQRQELIPQHFFKILKAATKKNAQLQKNIALFFTERKYDRPTSERQLNFFCFKLANELSVWGDFLKFNEYTNETEGTPTKTIYTLTIERLNENQNVEVYLLTPFFKEPIKIELTHSDLLQHKYKAQKPLENDDLPF